MEKHLPLDAEVVPLMEGDPLLCEETLPLISPEEIAAQAEKILAEKRAEFQKRVDEWRPGFRLEVVKATEGGLLKCATGEYNPEYGFYISIKYPEEFIPEVQTVELEVCNRALKRHGYEATNCEPVMNPDHPEERKVFSIKKIPPPPSFGKWLCSLFFG